jgi:hypothetical protein
LRLPHNNITQQGYRHIRLGMTRAEVEVFLGGPAGDYTRGRCKPDCESSEYEEWEPPAFFDWGFGGADDPPGHYEMWVGEHICIVVWFDQHGAVLGKGWDRVELENPDWLDDLRERVGW